MQDSKPLQDSSWHVCREFQPCVTHSSTKADATPWKRSKATALPGSESKRSRKPRAKPKPPSKAETKGRSFYACHQFMLVILSEARRRAERVGARSRRTPTLLRPTRACRRILPVLLAFAA